MHEIKEISRQQTSDQIIYTDTVYVCPMRPSVYPTVSNSLCVLPPSLLQVDYVVIASQAGATLNNLMSHAQELVGKLRSLQLDQREFVCLKFLVLFSLGEY